MSPARTRADACPGVLAPHDAADGALARVRLPGGVVTAAQLRVLAGCAEELGDGAVHLTSRGNLQLRGLDRADPRLVSRLSATGLIPAPAHERVRNVLASPLSGLDSGVADVRGLARTLDDALCAVPVLAALPGRFLFALDDGRGDVASERPDLCWRADAPDHGFLQVAGVPTSVGCAPAEAPALLVAAAEVFLTLREEGDGAGCAPGDPTSTVTRTTGIGAASTGSTSTGSMSTATAGRPGAWRAAEIPDAPARIAAALAHDPRFGSANRADRGRACPDSDHGCPLDPPSGQDQPVGTDNRADRGRACPDSDHPARPEPRTPNPTQDQPTDTDNPADRGRACPDSDHGRPLDPPSGQDQPTGTDNRAHHGPTRPPVDQAPAHAPLGPIPRADGGTALGVAPVLGELSAAQLRALAAAAPEVIVTPWRTVLLPDPAPDARERLRAEGLVLDAADPAHTLSACAGRPGCARSHADVRADVRTLLDLLGTDRLAPQQTPPSPTPTPPPARQTTGRPVPPMTPPTSAPPQQATALPRAHVVGCERRCGAPHGQHLDVVAQPDGTYRIDDRTVPDLRTALIPTTPIPTTPIRTTGEHPA